MTMQSDFLKTCVRDFKIFIDTSSLSDDGADKFFQNIVPILERERKALIVPKSVGLELMKLANEWLSRSVSRTSQSMPGDTVKLDLAGIKGWADL